MAATDIKGGVKKTTSPNWNRPEINPPPSKKKKLNHPQPAQTVKNSEAIAKKKAKKKKKKAGKGKSKLSTHDAVMKNKQMLAAAVQKKLELRTTALAKEEAARAQKKIERRKENEAQLAQKEEGKNKKDIIEIHWSWSLTKNDLLKEMEAAERETELEEEQINEKTKETREQTVNDPPNWYARPPETFHRYTTIFFTNE